MALRIRTQAARIRSLHETTDQRSNSRPFSRKPPSGKRCDIVLLAMVYNGFCTTEQAEKMTTEQVLELWSEHKKTEAARSDLTHERLDVLNAHQEAGVDIISDFLSNETRWISEEMSLHILETERNQIRKVNLLREVEGGYYLCMLCSKNCSHVPQDPHLTSKEHREKESEEIYMNRLFGDSSSLRRHGPGCAIATRSAVRSYWGIEIENLLTVLREKLKTSPIKYRFGGKGSKVYSLDASDEPKLHLGLIRYMQPQADIATRDIPLTMCVSGMSSRSSMQINPWLPRMGRTRISGGQ